MDQSNALIQFSDKEIELLKKTICPGADNLQLALFIRVCGRLGLDPFARQIYAVFRNEKVQMPDNSYVWQKKMTIQTSIDGYRLLAQRSKEYTGQEGPWWYDDETKEWVDVWLKDTPPVAAKVGVMRKGFVKPIYAVARYSTYVARNKDGSINQYTLWPKMPEVMIAKVAEALALRRAYPAELSGIYIAEEMDQSNNGVVVSEHIGPSPDIQEQQMGKEETVDGTVEKQAPLTKDAPNPEEKVMQGIQNSVAFQKERAYSEKLIHNEEQWQALLDYLQIKEFKTGKDVYTLRTGIDQMIRDAAKQQPVAQAAS